MVGDDRDQRPRERTRKVNAYREYVFVVSVNYKCIDNAFV